MPATTDLAGLAAVTIAIAAVCVAIAGALARARGGMGAVPARIVAVAAVVASLAVTVNGWPLAYYVRAVIDDPSVTTVVLALGSLARRLAGTTIAPAGDRRLLQVLVLAGSFVYPVTLQVSALEPYRWGYGEPWFVFPLLGIAALAAWRGALLTASCIALAVLAHAARLYNATNLWNYLIDPMVAIWAGCSLGAWLVRTLVRTVRARTARRGGTVRPVRRSADGAPRSEVR